MAEIKSKALEKKIQQYELLQKKKELQVNLPHLYSFKFYKWAKEFFESRNKVNLLCAANQISKSSTQIRKCIHWCTEPKLWGELWETKPRQIWYLYPSKDIVESEFKTKWEPEFMPRDYMVTHNQYGWKVMKKAGDIVGIQWNTGVTLYFKTYSQNPQYLQSGTVHAIFADEELPVDIFDELMFRLAASNGYYHQVFTATLGQEFWRMALEVKGKDEALKGAFKTQVSMYDCLEYEDGSSTPWTKKKIAEIKNKCKSDNEVQRRVYGKFVKDSGLKYPCFAREMNMVKPYKIPADWLIYTGVDIGSGGKTGHPAAMSFIGVRPDFQKGAVFKGWRGGKSQVTTASDILDKYRILRGNLRPIMQLYDWSSSDFFNYASRLNETFTKAEKSHDIGEDMINVLFKNGMLEIFDTPELQDLAHEISSLSKETVKRFAKDDFVDSMRYGITKIPWDWSAITSEVSFFKEKKVEVLSETDKRRRFVFDEAYEKEEYERIEQEISDYNELFA